jgi:glycosyltransferase involved in cell wall biosynthesis
MKISIVVTVYSETFSLVETIKRLMKYNRDYIYEIILVVSPKSSQECFAICNNLAQQYSFIKVQTQKNNPGVGWAIREGMKLSTGNYVVLISADLETEPEAVDRMIKKIEETGCDGVIGNRWLPEGGFVNYNKTKLVLNYIFQKTFKVLFRTKLGDLTYGFKVLSKKICDNINWEGTLHEIYIETTIKPIKNNYYIEQIPTVWVGRSEGKSSNSFLKNFRYVSMAFKVLSSKINI